MPGRGQPWKKGGHIDETIDSADIIDGTISEADLDSALTSKVNQGGHAIQDEGTPITQQTNMNFIGAGVTATFGGEDTTNVTIPGGGGVYTKLGEFTVSSAQATMPVTFSASQAPGTYKEILVVADFDLAVADEVDLELTGPTGFTFTGRGVKVSSVTVVAGYTSPKTDLIGTGETFATNISTFKVTIQSDTLGNYIGLQDEVSQNATEEVRRGGWTGDTNAGTTVTGIVVKSVTQNFNIGSKVSVYVLA